MTKQYIMDLAYKFETNKYLMTGSCKEDSIVTGKLKDISQKIDGMFQITHPICYESSFKVVEKSILPAHSLHDSVCLHHCR